VADVRTRLAILADPHYYAPELGTSGPAFESDLGMDTKCLRRAPELLDEALRVVREREARLLLVPGDLTKDGEGICHRAVAGKLAAAAHDGPGVLVLPGNHDLNNPWACSYADGERRRIPGLGSDEFLSLYGRFGYEGAVLRDAASLSYVAEPVPGLWILAIDVCRYDEATTKPITGGRLKDETAAWAIEALAQAGRQGKTVLGLMHHNLLEHHRFQSLVMGDFIVADHEAVARTLAEAGLKIVFTGHYHTQDTALAAYDDGSFIFDVETGSILTYPCPLRFVEVDGPALKITTVRLTEPPAATSALSGECLQSFETGIRTRAASMLKKRGLDPASASGLIPQVIEAYLAHTLGDERIAPQQEAGARALIDRPEQALKMIGAYLEALWTYAPPPDNDLTINLRTGTYTGAA
jgi:hypothetical protein